MECVKMCPSCGVLKSVDDFGKHRSKPDGYQNYCKDCRSLKAKTVYADKTSKYQAKYRAENHERLSEYGKERYLNDPEPYKKRAKEWKNLNPERKKFLDKQWALNNRQRVNENSRKWVQRNPEKRKVIVTAYDRSHKEESRIRASARRAKVRNNGCVPYTKEQLMWKLEMSGYECYICSERLDTTIHWDHVKPIAAGGPDMLSNLRPTHAKCNQSKGGRWPFPVKFKRYMDA